jgi:hypothetical protein
VLLARQTASGIENYVLLTSLEISHQGDFHIGKAKTYVVVAIRRVVVVAICYTQVRRIIVVPTTATIHSVRAFLLATLAQDSCSELIIAKVR